MIVFVGPRKDFVWHNKNLTEPLKWRALELAWARKFRQAVDRQKKKLPTAMKHIVRNVIGPSPGYRVWYDDDDVLYTIFAFTAVLLEEGDTGETLLEWLSDEAL